MLPSTSISEPNSLPSLLLLSLLSLFFLFFSFPRFPLPFSLPLFYFPKPTNAQISVSLPFLRIPPIPTLKPRRLPFRAADVGPARSLRRSRHRHRLLQSARSDHALHETPTTLLLHETALRSRRRLPPFRSWPPPQPRGRSRGRQDSRQCFPNFVFYVFVFFLLFWWLLSC